TDGSRGRRGRRRPIPAAGQHGAAPRRAAQTQSTPGPVEPGVEDHLYAKRRAFLLNGDRLCNETSAPKSVYNSQGNRKRSSSVIGVTCGHTVHLGSFVEGPRIGRDGRSGKRDRAARIKRYI